MPPAIPGPLSGPRTLAKFVDGRMTYEQRANTCGKANCRRCNPETGPVLGHGGYWYMCFPHKGRWMRIYLGKTVDTKRFRQANGEADWPAIAAHKAAKKAERAAKKAAKEADATSIDVAEADKSPPGDPPARHFCYVCNRDLSPGSPLFGQRAAANLCGECEAANATPEGSRPLLLPPPAGADTPKTQEALTAP